MEFQRFRIFLVFAVMSRHIGQQIQIQISLEYKVLKQTFPNM